MQNWDKWGHFGKEITRTTTYWSEKSLPEDQMLRVQGGVQPQNLDFLGFYICYSPGFLVFRMGSFVSQLCTVAEIWRDEVGPYAHFFAKMYGKIGLKIENFHINGRKSENLPGHLQWNLVDMFIPWSYKNAMRACCTARNVQKLWKIRNLNIPCAATGRKNKIFTIPA